MQLKAFVKNAVQCEGVKDCKDSSIVHCPFAKRRLTMEKHDSIGLNQGEYGGVNNTDTPML
jgi:hypothetical protein